MKKKLATEIFHAIPEVIEEGLIRDGEVRVKGLGTFRMKWTRGRTGRNPVTGEDIDIPAHYRLVFLPEQSLKEFINEENKMLGYKVIEEEEVCSQQSAVGGQQSEDRRQKTEDGNQHSEIRNPKSEIIPELPVRRRRIHWIIPVAVVIVAVLSVVFYFRNFYQTEQQSEDRREKSEDRRQKSEDRRERSK
jgi:DNA-binding protein HU-beta